MNASTNKDTLAQPYTTLATKLIGDIHNTGISTKILQFMQKVRNNSDERYALRWVSELLQNTRDCAYKDQGIKILIELKDDKLVYKHNSKPFRVKDILSLINQVTSKVDDDETTGKFGTGFMTTMLLSDVVNIKSVLQDKDLDKDLPYKPFDVDINRSPETSQEIVNEINKSITQLYKADKNEEILNFNKDDYNTIFTYELKNDKNRKAAMKGIQNLNETIYYIFAFSNKYKSIKVSIDTKNKKEQKEFTKEKEEKIADNTYEIKIKEDNNKIKTVIVYRKEKENISLAMMVDEDKKILPVGEQMPKLFISFPLIGSENFPFPIVINCQDFQPNETRSNIALVENDDSTDSKINKEIINKSVGFFEEFLEKLIELNYQNFENFIKIAKYTKDSERSEGFVKRNIYQNLYSIIEKKEIIKCNDDKMRCLNNKDLYIIYDEDDEVRKEMKNILSRCKNIFYPIEPDNWKKNLEGYEVEINNMKNLENIVIDIDKKNKKFINIEDDKLINWLNDLFKIIRKKPELYNKILYDKYRYFPCQESEIFSKLEYCKNIFVDPGISDYIKNITFEIDDNLSYSKRLYLKQKLLSKSFILDENDKKYIHDYDLKKIDEYIKNFLKNKDNYSNQKTIEEISKKVLCVKNEPNEIFDLMNFLNENNLKLIDNGKNNDSKIEIISEETMEVAIKNCLDIILSKIKNYSNLEYFSSFLKEKDKCFIFLNKFYEKLKRYDYYKFTSSRIILNCKGEFKTLKELYGNKIKEDELYSIYKKLGKTFDDSIIHKEINLDDLHESRTDKDVAEGIEEYYKQIFLIDEKDINRVSEDIKAISIGLFDWMEKNKEKVQNLMKFFKDEKNRARLLDLTVVNKLHEKSKLYDAFRKFFNNDEECNNFIKNNLNGNMIMDIINYVNRSKNIFDRNSFDLDIFKNNIFGKIIKNYNVYICLDDLPPNIKNQYNNNYEQLLQIIGNAGEKAAYNYLIEEYKKEDYFQKENEKDFNCTKLYKKNKIDYVEIKLCNSDIYKQPGYDIEIIINENGQKITRYVEVKTHTISSILGGIIRLSYNQYCLSRGNKDYIVIVMKAFFSGNEIKCELNKKFDPFYSYEGKEVRPEQREYIYFYE